MTALLSNAAIIWTMITIGPGSGDQRQEVISDKSGSSSVDTESAVDSSSREKSLFSLRDIMSTFVILTRERTPGKKLILILVLVVYSISIFPDLAMDLLYFPLTQLLYNWNVQTLSQLLALSNSLGPIAVVLLTFIVSKLNVKPATILLIPGISSAIGYLFLCIMSGVSGIYAFSVFASLRSVTLSGVQSIASLVVDDDEICKVYSVIQFIESAESFVAPVIATKIFSATMPDHPKVVILVFFFMIVVSLSLTVWITVIMRRKRITSSVQRKT